MDHHSSSNVKIKGLFEISVVNIIYPACWCISGCTVLSGEMLKVQISTLEVWRPLTSVKSACNPVSCYCGELSITLWRHRARETAPLWGPTDSLTPYQQQPALPAITAANDSGSHLCFPANNKTWQLPSIFSTSFTSDYKSLIIFFGGEWGGFEIFCRTAWMMEWFEAGKMLGIQS